MIQLTVRRLNKSRYVKLFKADKNRKLIVDRIKPKQILNVSDICF